MNTENIFRALGCCALTALICYSIFSSSQPYDNATQELPTVVSDLEQNTDV